MLRTIAVVDVDTGLIAEMSRETMTSDVPADIEERATEASLDENGHLHYAGLDGRVHVCEATTRKLREREPSDLCFLSAPSAGGDRTGRFVLHLCVLEPTTAPGQDASPEDREGESRPSHPAPAAPRS
jgi:hypothetical protein